MKLENIGFYTLSDERAMRLGKGPLVRAELLITDKCNFKCPYCRGCKEEDKGTIKTADWKRILQLWVNEGLENVRFSGGEPTTHPELLDMVAFCKENNVKRIAVSTNGAMPLFIYTELLRAGVNDFSISLDACCAADGDKMAGGVKGAWEKVVANIKALSALTYVTVGIVLTEENEANIREILDYASKELGVSDIRVISSAQYNKMRLPVTLEGVYQKHPILFYRLANLFEGRNVRGLTKKDTPNCHLVKDDIAVLNGKHYPCIIHLREGGKEIGLMGENFREERNEWFKNHNSHEDPICAKNCLDVCIDYNNKCESFKRV